MLIAHEMLTHRLQGALLKISQPCGSCPETHLPFVPVGLLLRNALLDNAGETAFDCCSSMVEEAVSPESRRDSRGR